MKLHEFIYRDGEEDDMKMYEVTKDGRAAVSDLTYYLSGL